MSIRLSQIYDATYMFEVEFQINLSIGKGKVKLSLCFFLT